MSYVHDIHLDLDYDRNAFAAAVEDIRTLFGRSELPVVGPSSRPGSQPLLDDDFIGFNEVNNSCECDPRDPDYHGVQGCPYPDCWPPPFIDAVGQPFVMDLKPERPYGVSVIEGRYWFDCKTGFRPYDLAVMLAMIALKHHLGDQIEMRSKSVWSMWQHTRWGHAWGSASAVELYEHVFPERAPVQNVLSREGGYG